MIDKKFAMRSTSSASLHQNFADVFFLEMIISDQSPGQWRGFAFLWRAVDVRVSEDHMSTLEEERIGEMQTNFVQSLGH